MRFIDIIETSERYRGVIEPNSRPRFRQEITLQKPVLAYHATHEALGKVLSNREIKTYNSMGTYLTSNRDMATTMYGPNVEAYQIPPGRYLLARRNQDFWELVLNCLPIIEQTIGKEAADHLRKYPMTGPNIQFMKDLRIEAKREMVKRGEDTAAVDISILRWSAPEKVAKYRALEKSKEYYTKVCRSADYCKAYRSLLESSGLHGIIWNGRTWDNSPEKQTVFLVFHQEDLHPISTER
jgi:hypothetical protein